MKASNVALALYIAPSGPPGAGAGDQILSLSGDDLRIDEADYYEDHEDEAG